MLPASSRTDSDSAGLDTHRFDAPIFRATTPAATRTARFGRDRASSHWRGRSAFRRPSESPNAFSGSRHPRRSPGTDRGCIRQRQSTDATGVADSTRSRPVKAKRHRQDVRRQNIDKTAAGKHQQDKPPTARESPAAQRTRRRDEGIGSAGRPVPRIEAIRCTRASCGTRASPASESPRARRTSANAIYRANSARQARRTPQDSPRAKSILNSRGSLSAFRRAGPVQGWPSSRLAQALKTRRARLRKPSRFLEELAEFRTG